ncbi:glycoside hydrolase N-terminal domain-containing protein [Polaribacter sp. AHE13PA]|uniref:glycoside hydrolase family 95 protein n=1 Tax=Polaribacter sp. AHE13PA TaxID=2745562 RepID=UPI001C4FDDE2|nr:glycoside hydrolase family 95 protein [Polaribacter sp. AHE13PA]QXP66382.1 glycoside hydrolase family 95 protein [Polaribacter sp. AHE13PA]
MMKTRWVNIHNKFIKKFAYISLIAFTFFGCNEKKEVEEASALNIWFNQPTNKWNEGLPIGNGNLGAMIYGTPKKEIICLNEETIWTGGKDYNRDKKDAGKHIAAIQKLLFDEKYMEAEAMVQDKILADRLPTGSDTYQMLGNLFIETPNLDSISNYKRALDINKSVVTTNFKSDDVQYTRTYFSSFPDKAMVYKFTADQKGKINISSWVKRNKQTKITVSENSIAFSEHVGNGHGVKFHALVHFETKGGTSTVKDGKLVITDADEVQIKVVASTNYRGLDFEQENYNAINKILKISYNELLDRHIADYQSLFNRLSFKLSDSKGDDFPTDVRLQKVKKGATDNYLTQLQYQFGRYLLISSSRPGTLPANLQGIWANGFTPPWNSDYHININIQMNYWMAEMANLAECHEPFLEYIDGLREMGRITAKKTYNSRGFVAHHTSNIWHATAANGKARYGMWPMGAGWSAQHLFTHYEYTEDKEYLKNKAYPIMREAALFFVDFMVPDPKTGLLVTGPSVSPENNFLTKDGEKATLNMGPAMDREIIFELFRNCIVAAEILNIDKDFSAILKQKIKQMPPLEIGKDGRLLEWVGELKEAQPGHRHISHLYALHPSNQISKSKTPELFEAAKKTIEGRLSKGGGHTGWSRAWIINFYARLLEGNKAYENIIALQRKSTLPNLLDVHPPFQIDGNFGVVSGITEMLMQSHNGEVHVLPALPDAWASGSIKGIVAKKGFEIDMTWELGKLKTLVVTSKLGNTLKLRYNDDVKEIATKKGEVLTFNY